jgi:hypothetical protein
MRIDKRRASVDLPNLTQEQKDKYVEWLRANP